MPKRPDSVRFNLTPEQQEQIKRVTGKEAETLELTVQELEARIAPMASRVW